MPSIPNAASQDYASTLMLSLQSATRNAWPDRHWRPDAVSELYLHCPLKLSVPSGSRDFALAGWRYPNDQAPELRVHLGRDSCFRLGVPGNSFDIVPEGRDRAHEHMSSRTLKNAATDHLIEKSFRVVFLGKTL